METLGKDNLVEILTYLSISELDRVEESVPNEESSPSDWNSIVQEAWKFHAHRLHACFPEIDVASATSARTSSDENNHSSILDYKKAVHDFLRVQTFTNVARKAQCAHYGANGRSLFRNPGYPVTSRRECGPRRIPKGGYPVGPRRHCWWCNLPNFSDRCLQRMRGSFGNDPALRFFVRLGSSTSQFPHYLGWALEKRSSSSSRRTLILELSREVSLSKIGSHNLPALELTISAMDVATGEILLAFAAGGASYFFHRQHPSCGGFVRFHPRPVDAHPNAVSLARNLSPKIHAKLGMCKCSNEDKEDYRLSGIGVGGYSILSISIDEGASV